jgi:hypothetical protein
VARRAMGPHSRIGGGCTRRLRMDTGSCHKECLGPSAFLLMSDPKAEWMSTPHND